MKKYHIAIDDNEGTQYLIGWYQTSDAIAKLSEVIYQLRRPDLQQIDASFGEFPLPITGPNADELREFINRAECA